RGLLQINAGEQDFHVLERIDGHAALAYFAFARRMIRVVTHQCGKIESHWEAAAAVLEQILVALIGFFRRGEAGELAHGKELAPISGGVNTALERRLTGITEVVIVIPIFGKISLRVEAPNGNAGDRGEAGIAVFVKIYAAGCADRLLGRFL